MENKEKEPTALNSTDLSASAARKLIYRLLIVVAMGVGFGKIVSIDSVYDRAIQNYRLQQIPKTLEQKAKELMERGVGEERFDAEMKRVSQALWADANKARPTLSANDRSRWATIRALVEPKMRVYRYVPVVDSAEKDARIKELNADKPESEQTSEFKYYPNEILRNTRFDCPDQFTREKAEAKRYKSQYVPYAIDNVWETPGWDSIDVVKHGLNDEVFDPSNPSSGYIYSSKPTLLPTVMAGPYWILYNWFGVSMEDKPFEAVRILLIVYNLVPLGIAFLCLASIVDSFGKTDWGRFFAVAAMLFASFTLTFVATLTNHLPGFVCISISLWAAMKILHEGKSNWYYFALAGFFGAFGVACELPSLAYAGLLCLFLLIRRPVKTALVSIPFGLVVAVAFLATDFIAHQSFTPAYAHKRDHMTLAQEAAAKAGEGEEPELAFDPNDWYYHVYYSPGRPREAKYARLSHWANRTGIDQGEPSIARYAFHSTIGSRGVFSLAPIWIFSVLGALALLFGKGDRGRRELGAIAITLTIVFFAFFLTRDQGDRNYGGMSCYPRWFFPLIPLFIPAMTPVVDALSKSRLGRGIACLALFIAAASATYPTWSPWVSPWLYQLAVDWKWMTPY
jgi:hypothetical protein